MATLKYKISTNTPTEELKDRILQALAGQSVDAKIAYLRVKTSDGSILGEVAVASSDWENYTLTKAVNITQSGQASYFSLDASDGAELYTYILPEPVNLNAGDIVQITWSIGTKLGTKMLEVGTRILDYIIGATADILVKTIEFYYQGNLQASVTADNVTADIENNKVDVTGSITPSSDLNYDEVRLRDSSGNLLFRISNSGTLPGNTTTNFTITVNLK
ncbi:MAG: hypothetical protein DRO40_09795 [Thermoprotei archaeon]|nr:MAG: hypothetical protein DRO40_09795 [Thermoprotei archaeon]